MKNKKTKLSGKLRLRLAYLFFNVLLIANILTALIFYILTFFKIIIFPGRFGTFGYIIALLITSLIIGTFFGYFITERYFRPLKQLSDASKKIADGDFTVNIDELEYKEDETELNNLIKNFNIMVKKLSKIETLRSDFIANVSHEFKTPLATIQGYVTLLEDDKLTNEEKKHYLKIIFDATKKLTNLSSNILKITKLENQEVEISKTEYNISEQIREVIILLQSSWEKKNIEIETEIEEDVVINADGELLSLVWNNLFSNAFKFTDDGGKVTLKLKSDGDFAIVKIKDTGCGMTAEVGAHIFEKFYQADSSRATQGNGLGLALVKRVVDIMQGDISVDSAVGVGTEFTVRIRRSGNDVEEVR